MLTPSAGRPAKRRDCRLEVIFLPQNVRLTSRPPSRITRIPISRDDLEGSHHFVIFMIKEMTVIDKLTRYIEVGNNLGHRAWQDTQQLFIGAIAHRAAVVAARCGLCASLRVIS